MIALQIGRISLLTLLTHSHHPAASLLVFTRRRRHDNLNLHHHYNSHLLLLLLAVLSPLLRLPQHLRDSILSNGVQQQKNSIRQMHWQVRFSQVEKALAEKLALEYRDPSKSGSDKSPPFQIVFGKNNHSSRLATITTTCVDPRENSNPVFPPYFARQGATHF
jgi:hypothetical protein